MGHELRSLRALHPLPCPVQGRPYILDRRSLLDLLLCHLELNFVLGSLLDLLFRSVPTEAISIALKVWDLTRERERETES